MRSKVRVIVLRMLVVLSVWTILLIIVGISQAVMQPQYFKLAEYVVFALWFTLVAIGVVWVVLGAARVFMRIK